MTIKTGSPLFVATHRSLGQNSAPTFLDSPDHRSAAIICARTFSYVVVAPPSAGATAPPTFVGAEHGVALPNQTHAGGGAVSVAPTNTSQLSAASMGDRDPGPRNRHRAEPRSPPPFYFHAPKGRHPRRQVTRCPQPGTARSGSAHRTGRFPPRTWRQSLHILKDRGGRRDPAPPPRAQPHGDRPPRDSATRSPSRDFGVPRPVHIRRGTGAGLGAAKRAGRASVGPGVALHGRRCGRVVRHGGVCRKRSRLPRARHCREGGTAFCRSSGR